MLNFKAVLSNFSSIVTVFLRKQMLNFKAVLSYSDGFSSKANA
jgi:hypothetical protein